MRHVQRITIDMRAYSSHCLTLTLPLQTHPSRRGILFAHRARVPRHLHTSQTSWSKWVSHPLMHVLPLSIPSRKTVSMSRLPRSSSSPKRARKDPHDHPHTHPSANVEEMATETGTGIKRPVRDKHALTPTYNPPILPKPIRNRNLHLISPRRNCYPKRARSVAACSARRSGEKEERGPSKCTKRGLQLPTLRVVRQHWMADHDGCANVTMRVVSRNNRTAGSVAVGSKLGSRTTKTRNKGETTPSCASSPQQQPQSQSQSQSQSHPLTPQPEREREVDLFSTDSPTITYQSPFRRGKPKPQAPLPSIYSSVSAPTPSTQTPMFTSSGASTSQRPPPQPPRRFTTTITLSAPTTSTSHKSAGTDAYKRGDFPVALAAYMRALSVLPPEHILRVPILANVALVRSKVGQLRDTIKACEEAVVIVRRFVGGSSWAGGGGGELEMSFTGTESDFDEKTPVDVGTGKVSVLVQGDGDATSNRCNRSTVRWRHKLARRWR